MLEIGKPKIDVSNYVLDSEQLGLNGVSSAKTDWLLAVTDVVAYTRTSLKPSCDLVWCQTLLHGNPYRAESLSIDMVWKGKVFRLNTTLYFYFGFVCSYTVYDDKVEFTITKFTMTK